MTLEGAEINVRPATPHDVTAAAEVLADAFADYAWTRWTVAADKHLERLVEMQKLYLSAIGLPFGHVDVVEHEGRLLAAAAWIETGVVPHDAWTQVGTPAAELAGDRASIAETAEQLVARHRPAGRHVTLASLGVVRDRQGRGLGTSLLTPGLHRADNERVPTYLETSDESNVGFYRRHGFSVTHRLEMPAGGPRTWLMWRPTGTIIPNRAG